MFHAAGRYLKHLTGTVSLNPHGAPARPRALWLPRHRLWSRASEGLNSPPEVRELEGAAAWRPAAGRRGPRARGLSRSALLPPRGAANSGPSRPLTNRCALAAARLQRCAGCWPAAQPASPARTLMSSFTHSHGALKTRNH